MTFDGPSIECKDLWFSYEVAEVIGGTAKTIDKSGHESLAIEKAAKTRDGGLSVDAPRRQHDHGMKLVQKLQLAKVNMVTSTCPRRFPSSRLAGRWLWSGSTAAISPTSLPRRPCA